MQNARKTAGLQVEDRIELALGGDPALLAAAEAHRDYLAGETLAVELNARTATRPRPPPRQWHYSEQTEIDGLPLQHRPTPRLATAPAPASSFFFG